jgi:hypothetical protein
LHWLPVGLDKRFAWLMQKIIKRFCPYMAIALLISSALAIEKRPNLSGTWDLDPKKSDFPSNGRLARPAGAGYPGGGRGSGIPRAGGMGGGSRNRIPGGMPGQRGSTIPGGGRPGSVPRPAVAASEMDLTLKIEQGEKEVKISRSRAGREADLVVVQTYRLDGSESVNHGFNSRAEVRSNAHWEKDRLVIDCIQEPGPRSEKPATQIKEEFKLSKNGNVLTIKTTRKTPKGKNGYTGVYNRMAGL